MCVKTHTAHNVQYMTQLLPIKSIKIIIYDKLHIAFVITYFSSIKQGIYSAE